MLALLPTLLSLLAITSSTSATPTLPRLSFSPRAILPTGWSYSSCLVDSSTRTLATATESNSAMTIPMCLTFCAGGGYTYAGLENGDECWCSSTPQSVATSTSCTSPCAGSSSDLCGGAWAISVYKYTTPLTTTITTTPSSLGCYVDSSPRLLSGYSTTSSSMSSAFCISTCQAKGFAYAGTEYSNQCYCGNTFDSTKNIASSGCNTKCSGSTEMCGGSWRANVYAIGTATKSATPAATTTAASLQGWSLKGCYTDSSSRTLVSQLSSSSPMTPAICIAGAVANGFTYAGVENGGECWMGKAMTGSATTSSSCTTTCAGDRTQTCGGSWAIQIYASPKAGTSPKTTTTTTTTTPTPPKTTTTTTTTAPVAPTAYPTLTVPSSSNPKYVWAHHIIGNTYPYTQATWVSDIQLAQATGIDGFALNIGTDSWQPTRVAWAYAAAQQLGSGFKLFLSLDMTTMDCSSTANLALLQTYVSTYKNHPAAAMYNGKPILSTFAGQDCSFGQGSTNNGWNSVMGGSRGSFYFMPAFTSAPTGLSQYSFDAEINWGSAWPTGASDIETSRDQYFLSLLGSRRYVGTLSPGFFGHFSYKNLIWRGDDWLYAMRWEQIMGMRQQIDHIEIVSWNDYGESTYVGPIEGAMPTEAEAWATASFPHTDVLSLQAFYSVAWKTGAYPAITQDKAWVWSRAYPAMGTATSDSLGPPAGQSYTNDKFYAQVHLTAAASVILSTNAGSQTFQGAAGINRFSYPLAVGSGIRVQVIRNGQTTVNLSPAGFTFTNSFAQYNFNYIIKSSGA